MTTVGLLVTAVTIRQSSHPPASQHRRLLGEATKKLAELISEQWNHEARIRGLAEPSPLRVRWTSTGREVAASAADVLGPTWTTGRATRLKLHGDVNQVAATLSELPASRLVVIGAPGSGKTSLAVLLVRELLSTHKRADPIPVLLSLSMWHPEEHSLQEWLVKQITSAYPALLAEDQFGPDVVAGLLDANLIIPVLDGLDEVAQDQIRLAVTRLNNYLTGNRPVVVTCRAMEYQEIIGQVGAVLSRAAVVELEPVTHTEAACYLPAGQGEQGYRRWEPVTRHLTGHPAGPLAQVFSTPLMVHLARVVYREPDTAPSDLLRFTDPDELEHHLLRSYVPALYAPGDEPRGRRPCSPENAQRWLAFLAGHLSRSRTREFTWWQLTDAVPGGMGRRVLTGITLVAALGHLAFGVLSELPIVTLLLALALGPIVGVVMGLSDGQPSRVRLRPSSFLRGFAVGSAFALLAAPLILIINLVSAPPAGTGLLDTLLGLVADTIGAQTGLCLIGGILAGTVAFLIEGIGTAAGPGHPAGSRASLRADRTAFLTTTAIATLTVGSTWFGVLTMLNQATEPLPMSPLRVSVQCALLLGPIIGLTSGAGSAWLRFTWARLWLTARGRAPWRVLDFLDDAHDRGVLRRIGPAYQFRHARLQSTMALHDATSP
ncbi:NACHT domain-containing protein [Actinoplanes derwentensis]|uniref:NACHT domain-containing protein n=1 Tax=Actinoplanes derwentensis TaxID=113562 RepID=A0A1H2AWH3_9ACTN|nr:NACHT domain-containing protein [Actinoplanes derwentensis]SDT49846.1 NACHT domain-containing protein [Actinoplanes derwentensis]